MWRKATKNGDLSALDNQSRVNFLLPLALCLGSVVVKQFHVPAENQELILLAFEELGWPVHIDDPLPPSHDIDSKRRLHDTIKRLNGNQRRRLLQFHGNGKGTGLTWNVVEKDKA